MNRTTAFAIAALFVAAVQFAPDVALGDTKALTRQTITFRHIGSPTKTGSEILPLYTVPAGTCLDLLRYSIDAEKQGSAMPRGGDFTVSVSLWLPGQTDEQSVALAEATTLDTTRANIQQGNLDRLTLRAGATIKAVVYANLNTGPLSDYFAAVFLTAERRSC